MNIQTSINKLIYALSIKDKLYKINSFKFYSDKNKKYCTKYLILKRTFEKIYNPKIGEIEIQVKYRQDFECYSKIELLKYFIKEYREESEEDAR